MGTMRLQMTQEKARGKNCPYREVWDGSGSRMCVADDCMYWKDNVVVCSRREPGINIGSVIGCSK